LEKYSESSSSVAERDALRKMVLLFSRWNPKTEMRSVTMQAETSSVQIIYIASDQTSEAGNRYELYARSGLIFYHATSKRCFNRALKS
jgi:hypothetical protein